MMRTTAPENGINSGATRRGFGPGLRRLAAGFVLALAAVQPLPVAAQGQFAPVARVDGEVISAYELDQRVAFLTLLRAPGDVRALALDQLINEKIELREAARIGLVPDADAVKAGMEEFAARGNLSADEFVQLLGQAGVAAETFRDFVSAGIVWRDYARAQVLPKVTISAADIDQALATAQPQPGLRFLLSEIVLPAPDPASRRASLARAKRLTGLDEAGFADAAMRFSVGASRNNKGKMNWLDVTALPADVGAAVRGLQPGQTSRIIETEQDVRVYFVRDREEVSSAKPATMVDYAALLLPGGESKANVGEVAQIRDRVTSCDDLYPIGRGLAPEQLLRETQAESQVPAPFGATLAALDPGEIGTALTANGSMAILMLCSRGNELPRSLTRDMVAEQLRNQRVGTAAQMLLDTLRANAHVEILTR